MEQLGLFYADIKRQIKNLTASILATGRSTLTSKAV
jgi:hypothetical protein